ncbi:eukaryotic translation initiation factor eIF-2 [Drepanopeziza brunnea f. sp. 'multigermtubi' MB_m1]|uniref:Eukaryotic translation initiation factor eIF-2 n=1 Tax=Marssonina brunnea f. sp. multigermtubi (strain MB_m1) TaxID=1072389 RepID=K1WWZ2_MARBU|nr:eukaryotic translation initiation factor eIF-2 [Drepanopeziza brunnea f. sp. 'multigermtubi' MB_m1]EKD17062.1 eukaryotic translation initiation factor eIF-2 [Drepanopeziza brunnea f. sp. 'multigermtubi' MB_m1]
MSACHQVLGANTALIKTTSNRNLPKHSLLRISGEEKVLTSLIMADTEIKTPERKPRKSVAFSEGTTVVDKNGAVTMMDGHDDTKDTAQSHSPSTPRLSQALGAFTDPVQGLNDGANEPTNDDDVAAMLKGMKKKKSKKPKDAEDEGEGGEAVAEDGGLDLSSMKKKKKSKKPKETEDAFAAKIAALTVDDAEEGEAPAAAATEKKVVDEGDMVKGTGIWQHDSETKIPYEQLLSRFFVLLAQKNPDHASSGSRSYKIPPPQCLREGNKKTIFANIAEICKRMKRTDEHVTSYLFAELGTSGSVDGSRRLVIKGRFQQKQIENVLRRYIMEYVTCKTCRSPDTELNKGENRLYFITCNSCGSRRSVTAIKTGFSAQVGKRRRQQG